MDIRLQQLSYSSRLTLHKCPRKYQLYKLNSDTNPDESTDKSSVHFAFGHVVGQGIQNVFQGMNESQILWNAFLMWDIDLFADDGTEKKRANKSFWFAIAAIQRFVAMRANGLYEDWEIVTINGKPAVELSFIVHFPDGFTYKGFVDLVLRHKSTGEVKVIEVKTTNSEFVAPATYKNSAQATGYSIVLDVPFPDLSSYEVDYLIYKTKSREYEIMTFKKEYLARALWIREILLDVEIMKSYDKADIYPMHGESCYDFFRECEYMGLCTLSTERLTVPLNDEISNRIKQSIHADFEINLSINDLIMSQLNKETL